MITVRIVYFFVALAVLVAALGGIGGYSYLRSRRSRKYPYGKWESLLKRLNAVNRDNIALIARDLVDEDGQRRIDEDDLDLEPSQIWELIGGMEGLQVLEHNCTVLVDLVFYVQQWYPEALVIAEQLRRNTREIELHIDRLKNAEKNGRLETAFGDYAQRAVAIYYGMTRSVLSVYEQLNIPGFSDLQQAL